MATTNNQQGEEEAFIKVNTLLLKQLSAKVEAFPSRDMTSLLEHMANSYPMLRKVFGEASVQSAAENLDLSDTPGAADERNEFRVPTNATIVRPLSASVKQEVLEDCEEGISAIIDGLNRLVVTSAILWRLGSTAVLGLNSTLVMKVGNDIDLQHMHTVDYIKQHAPRVPIPAIHGILKQPDTDRIFLIMPRASGEPLDSKWQFLSEDAKTSIKEQLDTIFGDFRFIPASVSHETQAVFGGGSPRRCKDTRRQVRVAPGPISNEKEFNEFLTYNPQRTRSNTIAMIRSYLKDDHQLVLTHGDLHPRNIMVVINSLLHDPAEGGLPHEPLSTTNSIAINPTVK